MDDFFAKALKKHKVSVLVNTYEVQMFRCQTPGTWIYGFDVSFIHGNVIMTGDIGELTLCTYVGALSWLRSSCHSEDYVLSKVPHGMEVEEYKGKTQMKRDIREEIWDYLCDGYEGYIDQINILNTVLDDIEYIEEDGTHAMHQFYEAWNNAGLDSEWLESCTKYTDHVRLQLQALQWFCNQLDEMNFKIRKQSWRKRLKLSVKSARRKYQNTMRKLSQRIATPGATL